MYGRRSHALSSFPLHPNTAIYTGDEMIKTIPTALLAATLTLSVTDAAFAQRESRNPQGAGRFEFALIGDTPYASVPAFENVLAEINADRQIRFVLHAGDIKTGSSPCSDALFLDRAQRFSRFEAPFVLTPGDNEWTDCHRVAAGQYAPLERLSRLRDMFYPVPGVTLGQAPMRVETQAADPLHGEFVENVRWQTQGVTFATIHVVGSSNGLAPFDPASSVVRTPADDAEAVRRIAAAVAWIKAAYQDATASNSPGILFLFQANPAFEQAAGSPDRLGFDEVIAALVEGAVAFGRPVLLVHGDSHYMRMDKPVRSGGAAIPNITRVETFGDRDNHWLRIVVDPNSDQVFAVHQEIVDANK
jgi:hypothetical protein